MLVNAAFVPALMWNGRFFAPSGDPFDNSAGFTFPPPEGTTRFTPHDPIIDTLLTAQAHLPPTELVESAGFTGTAGTIDLRFAQFDDGRGDVVPPPDESGFRNEPIRQAVLQRLNGSPRYVARFSRSFAAVAAGAPIDCSMVARAIAEFEFTLVFADAPIDHFARGDAAAMTTEKNMGPSCSPERPAASAVMRSAVAPTRCSAIFRCTCSQCRRLHRNSVSMRET